MHTDKASARSGNCERSKGSSRTEQILPNWTAVVMGIVLGWPFLWAAVMW